MHERDIGTINALVGARSADTRPGSRQERIDRVVLPVRGRDPIVTGTSRCDEHTGVDVAQPESVVPNPLPLLPPPLQRGGDSSRPFTSISSTSNCRTELPGMLPTCMGLKLICLLMPKRPCTQSMPSLVRIVRYELLADQDLQKVFHREVCKGLLRVVVYGFALH